MKVCPKCAYECSDEEQYCVNCGQFLSRKEISPSIGNKRVDDGIIIDKSSTTIMVDQKQIYDHCKACGRPLKQDESYKCPNCSQSPLCRKCFIIENRMCKTCIEEQKEAGRRAEEEKRRQSEAEKPVSITTAREDSRKKRNTLAIVLGAVAIIAAIIVPVILLVGGSDGTDPPPVCTPGWKCDGDTRYYLNADCSESNHQICEYGCQSGECIQPPPTAHTLEMASIPGGTFNMGSSNGGTDEKPVHSVTLSPFSMSKYEITYAQWVKVKNWGESHGYSFNMPGDMGSEDYSGSSGMENETHPVTDIEWYDAVLWCNALSEMEGRTQCYYTSASQSDVYRSGRVDVQNDWVKWNANGYRLPTEAEWEYACRAGTTTEYSIGNIISGNNANYWDSGDSYDNGATPVGSYGANARGLYDMHGNVWEWCWDWYSPYSSSSKSNPRGSSVGSDRVVRGGGWGDYAEDLRSAVRNYDNSDDNYPNRGFRPVCSQ